MPLSTPNMGLPYPAATDAPDGPGAFYALAAKFDKLGAAWTPSIDGVGGSNEVSGWYMRVGGYCLAHGFLQTASGQYPSNSTTHVLNLPIPSVQLAGIPNIIGDAEYTRRSDFLHALGHIVQSSSSGIPSSKAQLTLTYANPNGGVLGTAGLAVGSPFTIGSTDAMYLNFRLFYWVGV